MKLKPIPLLRAAYLKTFVTVLHEAGVAVESELNRDKLPTRLSEQADAYLPLLPALSFVHRMEQLRAIEDFGLVAGQRLTLRDLSAGLQRELHQARTLDAALKIACELAYTENSHASYAMVSETNRLKLVSSLAIDAAVAGFRCGEWLHIMVLITIIRQVAGQAWCPTQIAFRSNVSPGATAQEEFPSTRFLVGQPESFIVLPARLLGQVCRYSGDSPPSHTASVSAQDRASMGPRDLSSSLLLALQAYLCDGHPPIQLAAELAGTSVRTLQRQLRESGLSYTELLRRARFEAAARLFTDPDAKVVDIAYALGYEDPSHFARAFRRMVGISPREFCTLRRRAYPLSPVAGSLSR